MATVMLMHWPDVTPDQYDQVRERARWDTDVPDGAKLHVHLNEQITETVLLR